MALTKKGIFFSLASTEDDRVRDFIPLHEVLKVDIVTDEQTQQSTKDPRLECGNLAVRSQALFFHSFQIETLQDGYNSGRNYRIRTESNEQCASVVATLNAAAKKARKAAVTASRFEKSQKTLLKIYNSFLFQSLSAGLILAVTRRAARTIRPPPLTPLPRRS